MKTFPSLAVAATLCISTSVFSQAYPSKPVRLVVTFPPGGVDVTMRPLIPAMEKELGQPLILEYRSGAGGVVGHEYVARQPADGHTIIITLATASVVASTVRRSTPFDVAKDFTHISLGYEAMGLIVAHPSFEVNNLTELVAWARKNPGKGTWATSGTGSSWHLTGELFKLRAGIDILHAPYQGFGPMVPAVLGGQVPMAMFSYSTIGAMVNAGKLKILGVTNPQPMFNAFIPPGMQTLADILPGMQPLPEWTGLAGPAGLPMPIVRRMQAAYVKALSEPEARERLIRDKIMPVGSTPEQFAERVKSDLVLVARAMKEAGVQPQD